MKLLIFPGTGNPQHPKYAEVYSLIDCLARRNGFASVDLSIHWPGHFSPTQPDARVLTLPSSVEVAVRIIKDHEGSGKPYVILARSYGTFVAMRAVQEVQVKQLAKIILWGVIPFWVYWDECVRRLDEIKSKCSEVWCNIDESCYRTLEPIEWLVASASVRTTVAVGTHDEYCSPGFFNYLKETACKNNLVHFPAPVIGARHSVTAKDSQSLIHAYERALFDSNS